MATSQSCRSNLKREKKHLRLRKKDRGRSLGKNSKISVQSRMLGSIVPQLQHELQHLDTPETLLSLTQLTEVNSSPAGEDSKLTAQSRMRCSIAPQRHGIQHSEHQGMRRSPGRRLRAQDLHHQQGLFLNLMRTSNLHPSSASSVQTRKELKKDEPVS